ncbi:rve domain-containing protein [Cucumis melo var. makuwa]|uniref:Rve domain-containing protein n=1 Tax=Cucumis melo var. makuwa TaxID=1194695 RepID=A0A5A7VMV5_CUCMM|nr:rve domain-containing protein [Cucumis melo var. makuwa]
MGPFPQSGGHLYILLVVDYVLKWVKAIFCMKNDVLIVSKFLKKNIFTRFRALISDKGSHFINRIVAKLLAKYNINHNVATAYHLQINGQVEVSNREIKKILEKVVNLSRKDWVDHLTQHYGHIAPRTRCLHELQEWRFQAYENTKIYKEMTMARHDSRIRKHELHIG